MARTFDSPRHKALRDFLVEKRKEAGLRQVDLAKRLKRRQDYVSYVETGQKLVEVVELMEKPLLKIAPISVWCQQRHCTLV